MVSVDTHQRFELERHSKTCLFPWREFLPLYIVSNDVPDTSCLTMSRCCVILQQAAQLRTVRPFLLDMSELSEGVS